MGYIDRRRRTIALSLGLFIIMIVVFLGMVGTRIINVSNLIDDASAYEKVKIEEFLDARLESQDVNISTIEQYWKHHLDFTPYSGNNPVDYIQQFINSTLEPQTNMAVSSVIIVSRDKNTILFNGYKKTEYAYIHRLIKNNNDFVDDTLFILNGDETAPFGTQHRFYMTRTTLELDDENSFYVYVGFLEDVMYKRFINALNLNAIEQIRNETQIILFSIMVFMGICISFGIYLMFYMRFFQEKIFNSRICTSDDCKAKNKK